MFTVPFAGVPDCAHASPSLPRGQQHDHAAPLLRWNLPVLGLVPSQSQWEDAERPFCLHGCLSPLCEYYMPCHIQKFNLFCLRLCSIFDVFSLSPYTVQTQTGLCVADILQERVILNRKEGESSKCLNELLLSRMSRFRASHSATLAALTGSAITNTVKEEQSGNSSAKRLTRIVIQKSYILYCVIQVDHMVIKMFSGDSFIAVNTSCGLPLKTLRKTPMYVCGTYLVMLVSPPGVSGSSATRSLFGGTSSLSSLKSKRTHKHKVKYNVI